jgi:hypothetical protein
MIVLEEIMLKESMLGKIALKYPHCTLLDVSPIEALQGVDEQSRMQRLGKMLIGRMLVSKMFYTHARRLSAQWATAFLQGTDPMTSSLGYGTMRPSLSAMRLHLGAIGVLYESTAT